MLNVTLATVHVDDQAKALAFYTEVLGLTKRSDVPLGAHRWLTVSGPGADGAELLLEPDDHPAAKAYAAALLDDGIPGLSLACDDVPAEHQRLVDAGVRFTQEPVQAGGIWTAVLDDTCGNLVQLNSGI
ncbi:VOC family protein [Euzebya tangerina]|uniref:VOC family protein n=1 Tax=Euzebya tangerina TaxID=591198 RepID=UPI000E31F62D|nr:VOC family protein [Euzebya tangerina]